MLEAYSQYARHYDESCFGWTINRKYNLMFLNAQKNYFNELLRKRGYLFLRDVYEGLGIPITKESCIVGWVFGENNIIGDNYVEFIYDKDDESACILIDFNVDGNIIDRF